MSSDEIWVVGELRGKSVSPWTLQLVSGAAEVGGGRARVVVALPDVAEDQVAEVVAHGADTVALVDQQPSTVEAMTAAVREALESAPVALVISPDTLTGREVAAVLAADRAVDVLSSCERLAWSDGVVEAKVACFGGQVARRVRSRTLPVVATVCEHVFRARRSDGSPEPSTRRLNSRTDGCVRVVERRFPAPEELGVTDAEVVVAGGRGVGERGFETLARLAGVLGGTVAASRVAVDEGWAPRTRQVGQTGHRVAPRLYLACGISGAIQHMAGIRDAEALVALNLDERAPIMREADLAAVGDAREVLPALVDLLQGSAS